MMGDHAQRDNVVDLAFASYSQKYSHGLQPSVLKRGVDANTGGGKYKESAFLRLSNGGAIPYFLRLS